MKPIQKGLVYAIVPARSGSQGVKNKNIRTLRGYPLMAYSIAAGIVTPEISRVIVSTDSERYAQIARRYGADVPFLRPEEISGSNATDLDFMRHVISWLDRHEDVLPEYWVHLRPTMPLRDIRIVRAAISRMLSDPTADSLRSAHYTDMCPFKWFWRGADGYYKTFNNITPDQANGPRQQFPMIYVPDGYVDVLKTQFIVDNNLLHGTRVIAFESPQDSVDLDTIEDLEEIKRTVPDYDGAILDYLQRFEKETELV